MLRKSKLTKGHLPCPHCPSSDGYAIYDDGHGYCYVCTTHDNVAITTEDTVNNKPSAPAMAQAITNNGKFEYVPSRGITRETMEFFNVKTLVGPDDEPREQHYPYPSGRTKIRTLANKTFQIRGTEAHPEKPLFGQDRFPGGKYITITEGELDAMSVFQMQGSKYAVVSVSSAGSARRDAANAYEYLNSFERIYLCFDSDVAGQQAAKHIANMFDFNKIYLLQMDRFKDANEYLQNGEVELFNKTWWNARRYMPEGIISTFKEFDKIIDDDKEKPSVPYPYETLQQMTYGVRTGEVVLFKALEGIGKTEIMRSIEYHLLKTTDENIGIIHLEESKSRILKGLAGYETKSPVHLPDRSVSNDEIKRLVRQAAGRDERVNIYSHFGSDDPDVILNTVRFMAGPCNCKYVFLDHITMVVSGLYGDDERRALDYISTRLAMMTEELDFALFMVSHVNDEGQTRGSRNIAKVAHTVISLNRDIKNPDPDSRNLTRLTIEKNRFAGRTGPSALLKFDPETFMLSEEIVLPE